MCDTEMMVFEDGLQDVIVWLLKRVKMEELVAAIILEEEEDD
jgi:hypothetical protein